MPVATAAPVTPIRSLDPVALIRWLAVTADLLDIPVRMSDAMIAQAKQDASNPTGTINVIVAGSFVPPDNFPASAACGWCGGSGVLTTDEDCAECEGTGKVEVLS